MKSVPEKPGKVLLPILGVVLTLLGFLGVLARDDGYTDALFEPDYTILNAPEGGALAEAGFLPGDSVVSVEGIPVESLGMYSRWPRSLARRPGESLTMTVERQGELISGEVVFREVPASIRKMQAGFLVVLLSFLWAGIWAFSTVPTVHASRLAAVGVAAGFAIPGPSLGTWDGLTDHVNVAAEVLFLLLLLRFLLFFPEPKKLARSRPWTVVMFTPWIILLGCLAVELIYHPRFYHSFGGFLGIVMLVYLLSAIVALIHSWVATPKGGEGRSGLVWVLAGMGTGLGGILLWAIDTFFLRGFDVPGTNWAPILFAVVPVCMALGVRSTRSGKN